MSGVGGNLFSTMSVLKGISVGNGGCIFGLLGAMHVDIVFSIMHENPPKKEHDTNTSQEEHDKNGDIEEDVSTSTTNEEDDDEDTVEEVEDTHIIQSSCIVLGFLVGVWLTSITRIVYPNSLRMHKDWSVFYGGMMSGLAVGLVWEFFVSLRLRQNRMVVRVTYGFLFVAVPFLFECLLSIETSQSILKVM